MHVSPISSSSPTVRLLVGLGNVGRQYDGTRHNIGFAVVDALARQHQVQFSFSSKWNADIAKVSQQSEGDFWLMKPKTLMNLSGTAVAPFAHFFRIATAEVLVILDDVTLPLGTIRLRSSGSSGGQRGLESVLMHFATESVPRLRLGIGSIAEGADQEDKNSSSKLPEASKNCVVPVLAPSSMSDTLSRCAPSASCSLLPSATLKIGSKKLSQIPLSDYVLARFELTELPHVEVMLQRALDAIKTLRARGYDVAMSLFNLKG